MRMTEKKYYVVNYGEKYYIFDSDVIRKGRVEEEVEYSYAVFGNSMSSDEVVDLLNNQNERIKALKDELKLYRQYVEFVPSNSSDFDD